MSNVHIHLHVSDLEASRTFYERFLGAGPVKVKPGYVKFLPAFAPINLALSAGEAGAGNPDGVEWEVYHLNYDVDEDVAADGAACCTPLAKIKLGRGFKQP